MTAVASRAVRLRLEAAVRPKLRPAGVLLAADRLDELGARFVCHGAASGTLVVDAILDPVESPLFPGEVSYRQAALDLLERALDGVPGLPGVVRLRVDGLP